MRLPAATAFAFLFQMALAVGVINFFCRTFGLGRRAILLHVPIVAALFLVTTIGPALLLLRGRRRLHWSARLVAVVPALTFVLVTLIYAGAFFGRIVWGNNINLRIVSLYLRDWEGVGAGALVLPPWVWLTTIGIAGVVLAVYAWLSRGMAFELGMLVAARARLWAVAVVVALAGLVGTAIAIGAGVVTGAAVNDDPLLAFFARPNLIYDFNREARLRRLAAQEPLARAAYRAPHNFDRRNVVLIIADSLRADHMQIYGYERQTTPFLARLRDQGRLRQVTLATSSCAESNCGILSTLTSRPLRGLTPGSFKLSDLLHDQGYRTYFVLSGNHDWFGLKEAYGREMSLYFDGGQSSRYRSADDRVVLDGLEQVPPAAGTPAFFYLHLMSTHLVGVKQDRYRRFNPSGVDNSWTALFRGDYDRPTVINNYDNGVLQADAMIEDVFTALDRKGYLRNSLVVILSDHGEALGDRGWYGHVNALWQELIHIPMLFVEDAPPPYANLDFATQVDVAPTILDRLGLPAPPSWEGRSLLREPIRRDSAHQTTVFGSCYAVISREAQATWKYHFCTRRNDERLFELNADPGETRDLLPSADRGLVDRLRARLRAEIDAR